MFLSPGDLPNPGFLHYRQLLLLPEPPGMPAAKVTQTVVTD